MDFTRQSGIISTINIQKLDTTIIGVGALGSFTALTLGKMGVSLMEVFDEDGVTDHNLPNQFYRNIDAQKKAFKVDALAEIVRMFSDCLVSAKPEFFTTQTLRKLVIVTTDSMASRKAVWEQFKKQPQCLYYVEARMGAELGRIYIIKKVLGRNGKYQTSLKDQKFYEETLYSDATVKPLPCTARSVIYNVLMIASLIGRAVKSIVNPEKFPRELVFDMKNIYPFSFMTRT